MMAHSEHFERANGSAPMEYSFIVPVCNEQDTLQQLFEHVQHTLNKLNVQTFEILFIDDGSQDQSWSKIAALQQQHPQSVRGIRLRRNFGKATALSVGFERAIGEIIFTIDADLQDDPCEIPRFIDKLNEGYDMVSGWKETRHDPLSKTLPSKLFNIVTRLFSGMQLHDFNCGFKAYRRAVVKRLNLYGELHRFIPIMANAEGFHVTEIPVVHHPRKHGNSKYGWSRLYKGFLDLLTVLSFTRYAQRPAHFFGGVGILLSVAGVGILGYFTVLKILGNDIGWRPLFLVGILILLLAAQLISLGIIGEMIVRNNHQPASDNFIVKDTGTPK